MGHSQDLLFVGIRNTITILKEEYWNMVDLYQMVTSTLPLSVLPICVICPVIVIILSLRLNFHLQASFLLYAFLLGSFLTGLSGLLCLYRHVAVYFELRISIVASILISKTQVFARTFLSTTATSIFIVKFFSKVQATRETVNNTGIGFFILILFAKFCCVSILPNVKFYSFQQTGQTVSYQIFEILEFFVDIICLTSTSIFVLITCNRAGASVQPLANDNVHEDSLPVTHPLQLPSFLAMTLNRVLLLLCLQNRFRFEKNTDMKDINEDGFVLMHALVTPLLTLVTNSEMRRQVIKIIRRRPHPETEAPGLEMFSGRGEVKAEEDSEMTDSEAGLRLEGSRSAQARRASHRPDSAPTRPSSAATAPGSLLPGSVIDQVSRRPYRSNLRSADNMSHGLIVVIAENTGQLSRRCWSQRRGKGSWLGRLVRRAGPWTG